MTQGNPKLEASRCHELRAASLEWDIKAQGGYFEVDGT